MTARGFAIAAVLGVVLVANAAELDAQGLMAYGPNFVDLHRRAATFVDKILKGARPGALPIEQLAKFDLVLNRKTAKTLGLTFPPALLARADEVVQ
jgi:putative ABC transport system substrate-binding protein